MKRYLLVLFIAFLAVVAMPSIALAENLENQDLVWGVFGGGEDIAFWNEIRVSPGSVAPGEVQKYSIWAKSPHGVKSVTAKVTALGGTGDIEYLLAPLPVTLVEGDEFLGKWETASWKMANVPDLVPGWQKVWGVSVDFEAESVLGHKTNVGATFKIEAETYIPPVTSPMTNPPVVNSPPIVEGENHSWNKLLLLGILGVIPVGLGLWAGLKIARRKALTSPPTPQVQ